MDRLTIKIKHIPFIDERTKSLWQHNHPYSGSNKHQLSSKNEQRLKFEKKGHNVGSESGEQHAIGLLTQRSFIGFNIVTLCTEKDQFSEEPLYT